MTEGSENYHLEYIPARIVLTVLRSLGHRPLGGKHPSTLHIILHCYSVRIKVHPACEERHLLKMFSVSAAKVCSPFRIFCGVRPLAVFLIEYNVSATPSIGPVRRLTLVDEPVEELLVPAPGRGTALAMGGAASKAYHAIKQTGSGGYKGKSAHNRCVYDS